MGLRLFSGGRDPGGAPLPRRPLEPDPLRFTVESSVKVGKLWLSTIHYPDCANYEGRKILVTRHDPATMDELDPHFTAHGTVLARFEPSLEGNEAAILFVNALASQG